MRRASICFAVLGIVAALAVPSMASASPPVKFKALAVPISGFKGTGNILGAGAAFQAEFVIERKSPTEGEEYGGYQPPLIAINVQLPKGTKLHTAGFPTCKTSVLTEEKEPKKCPKGSKAGPVGHALGYVVLENEHVEEAVTIESFFTPEGLAFFVEGRNPTIIEITSTGKYINLNGAEGFGPKFIGKVPLIASVPGAPFGSTEKINVKVGTAIKKGKETIFYGRVPKKCPTGGFPVKAELIFANLADLPAEVPGEITKVTSKAPCPPRKK
jgi:hypothetical protein